MGEASLLGELVQLFLHLLHRRHCEPPLMLVSL
jgi:hypothetical protein